MRLSVVQVAAYHTVYHSSCLATADSHRRSLMKHSPSPFAHGYPSSWPRICDRVHIPHSSALVLMNDNVHRVLPGPARELTVDEHFCHFACGPLRAACLFCKSGRQVLGTLHWEDSSPDRRQPWSEEQQGGPIQRGYTTGRGLHLAPRRPIRHLVTLGVLQCRLACIDKSAPLPDSNR